MYLGFSQMPLGVGWTLEGKIGPMLYDHFASKERIAREVLLERGLGSDAVAAIPQEKPSAVWSNSSSVRSGK